MLVKNRNGQFFVLLVERSNETEFERYVEDEGVTVCGWLDDPSRLEAIEKALVLP